MLQCTAARTFQIKDTFSSIEEILIKQLHRHIHTHTISLTFITCKYNIMLYNKSKNIYCIKCQYLCICICIYIYAKINVDMQQNLNRIACFKDFLFRLKENVSEIHLLFCLQIDEMIPFYTILKV